MRFVFALFLLFLTAGGAAAERRVALVIGIDRYEHLRPLTNAVNDARAVEDALAALGFEVTSESDRDLRRFRRAIEDFREDGAGADVALVFFAGHGVEIAGSNHLLPTDADAASPETLAATSLPLEELRDAVAAVAPVGLILLDACRNDPFGGEPAHGRGAGSLVPAALKDKVQPGLGRVGRAENVLFAFAAAPGATASDGTGKNSPFTTALTRYLATDGLEIRSVLTLVQQEVYDATSGAQLPYVESGLPKLFFAAAQRHDLPERERLLLAMADVTPDMRAEVEAVASDADMPLAPLYAALLSADLAARDAEDRRAELRAAAGAFVKVRAQMRALSSDDPQVAGLRLRAEERLAVGAFAEVHAALAEAAALDAGSRQSLKTNLEARTRSEAATHRLAAGAFEASLDYRSAVASYRSSLALLEELGDDRTTADDVYDIVHAARSIGDLTRDLGDLPAAQAAYADALRFLERRVPAAGEEAELRRLIGAVQDDLGDLARISGDLDGALARHEAAMAIRKAALEARPDSPYAMRGVAISHDYVGGVHSTRNEAAPALASYREALRLRIRAAELDAGRGDAAEIAADLAVSHFKVAHALRDTGDAAGAAAEFRAALLQDEKLIELDPADQSHRRSRISTLGGLAGALRDAGDFAGALEIQRMNRDALAETAAANPGIASMQWDVAAADREIGMTLRDLGDAEGAKAALRAAHDRKATLIAASPDNLAWRYDMAVADFALAGLLMVEGDGRGAFEFYDSARNGWNALVEHEPRSLRYRDVVGAASEGMGDALLAAGDARSAMTAFAQFLDVELSLIADAPDDLYRKRRLMRAYIKAANVGVGPQEHYASALVIARELAAAGALPPQDADIPRQLESALAAFGAKP
ncbi:MAG: caspase family protein [Rhizobiaceae bacterium]|nr:caspase family protein [Rhizobiaceae bacterium]